jgi:hypothetical protein
MNGQISVVWDVRWTCLPVVSESGFLATMVNYG